MEIRKISLIAFSSLFFLLPTSVLSELVSNPVAGKRPINSPERHDIVEGSGSPASSKTKNLVAADIEWEASGVGPDDEDGDVIEGSGTSHDEVNGSGAVPMAKPPSLSTKPTTTPHSPPPIFVKEIHDLDMRPSSEENDDVAIEEEVVTVPTSSPPPRTFVPSATQKIPIPTVFEEDTRNTPFDALFKPGILAAVIGGIVVGILAAILLVMFVVYRMRKKDEGSYALDEPKQPPHYSYAYQKAPTKEFYA